MPKRETNIRKRKDGRWEARYIKGKNEAGKSVYASVYGKTYTEAKEKRKARMAALSTQKSDDPRFSALYEEWLIYIRKRVKESTYARYRYISEHYILDHFANMCISSITTRSVEEFIAMKHRNAKDAYTASTINTILSVLKLILNYAALQEYPLHCCIDLIHVRTSAKEPRYLTKEEQRRIEAKISTKDDMVNLGIWLGLYTGLRIGELCALKWKDVLFESRCIRISKTLQRILCPDAKDGKKTRVVIDTPKSKSSNRIVPLSDFLFDKLSAHRGDPEAYVLTGKAKYMEPRVFEYHFDKLMCECDLQDVHFHTLRHTFTTRCIESGCEVKALSEILGHSSVSFTLDRYGHSSMKAKSMLVNHLRSTM